MSFQFGSVQLRALYVPLVCIVVQLHFKYSTILQHFCKISTDCLHGIFTCYLFILMLFEPYESGEVFRRLLHSSEHSA